MTMKVLEIWKDRDYLMFQDGDIVYTGGQDSEFFSTDFINAIAAMKSNMATANVAVVHWETNTITNVSFKHETSTSGVVTEYSDVSDSIFANLSTYSSSFLANAAAWTDEEETTAE